jgi:DNA-binding response OmpR family regulator
VCYNDLSTTCRHGNGNLRYLFEDCALDTDARELCRGTSSVPVEPQVFDLLVYLIRNRDRVVSKDDLIAADGRYVGFLPPGTSSDRLVEVIRSHLPGASR